MPVSKVGVHCANCRTYFSSPGSSQGTSPLSIPSLQRLTCLGNPTSLGILSLALFPFLLSGYAVSLSPIRVDLLVFRSGLKGLFAFESFTSQENLCLSESVSVFPKVPNSPFQLLRASFPIRKPFSRDHLAEVIINK